MGRIVKFIGILLFASLNSSQGYGDDLVTILQLALDNDPTLKQAQANYRANRENVTQSRSSLLPSLGVGSGTSRLTSGFTDSQYINVTNPLTGEIASVPVLTTTTGV